MSDQERDLNKSREEERLLDLLRRSPEAQARPEFLESLGNDFRSGRIESPYAGSSRKRFEWVHWRGIPPRLRPFGVGFATVVFLGALVLWMNSGKSFDSWTTAGDGSVVVDSRTVSLSERAALESMLHPGADVELRGDMTAAINLFYGDDYALQITPGTRLTVPRAPRRWFRRRADVEVLAGEARIVTGPGFSGARIEITTSNAQVDVVGTTLAVIAGADSTCLCVLEGTAQIRIGSAPPTPVPPMMRGTVRLADGSTMMEPIRPMEEQKLSQLRALVMPTLEAH